MYLGLRIRKRKIREFKLETLIERRHQADMCMVRNIMHIRGSLDPETWCAKPDGLRLTRSAADPLLMKKKHGRLEVRSNFFSIRVTEPWNGLPAEMRGILSPELSKRKYRYMELKASQMHHT